MPTITEINSDQAKMLLDEFKKRNQRPHVTPHSTHGHGHGILAWDFLGEDGSILRAPATAIPWVPHERATWPFIFMTTKVPVTLNVWNKDNRVEEKKVLSIGTRVRIVMVSRFGDVGITDDLTTEHGYHLRVDIDKLSEMFEKPSNDPQG